MYIPTSSVKPKYEMANSTASQKRGREGNSSHRPASYFHVYLVFLLLLLTLGGWGEEGGGIDRCWLFWNPPQDEASVSIYSKRFPAMVSAMLKTSDSSKFPGVLLRWQTDWSGFSILFISAVSNSPATVNLLVDQRVPPHHTPWLSVPIES